MHPAPVILPQSSYLIRKSLGSARRNMDIIEIPEEFLVVYSVEVDKDLLLFTLGPFSSRGKVLKVPCFDKSAQKPEPIADYPPPR